jgi:hypothetical protein
VTRPRAPPAIDGGGASTRDAGTRRKHSVAGIAPASRAVRAAATTWSGAPYLHVLDGAHGIVARHPLSHDKRWGSLVWSMHSTDSPSLYPPQRPAADRRIHPAPHGEIATHLK